MLAFSSPHVGHVGSTKGLMTCRSARTVGYCDRSEVVPAWWHPFSSRNQHLSNLHCPFSRCTGRMQPCFFSMSGCCVPDQLFYCYNRIGQSYGMRWVILDGSRLLGIIGLQARCRVYHCCCIVLMKSLHFAGLLTSPVLQNMFNITACKTSSAKLWAHYCHLIKFAVHYVQSFRHHSQACHLQIYYK